MAVINTGSRKLLSSGLKSWYETTYGKLTPPGTAVEYSVDTDSPVVVRTGTGLSVTGDVGATVSVPATPLEYTLMVLITKCTKQEGGESTIDWDAVIGEVTHRLAVAAEKLKHSPITGTYGSSYGVPLTSSTLEEALRKDAAEKSWETALLKSKYERGIFAEQYQTAKSLLDNK